VTEGLFGRREVARLLGMSEGEVRYWERTGLIRPAERDKGESLFDFKALVAFRAVRYLRREGLSVRRIRKYAERVKEMVPEAEQPLAEVRISLVGRQVVFHHAGRKVDPQGQLLLDFSQEGPQTIPLPSAAEDLFFRALQAEEEGRWEEAQALYQEVLKRDPEHGDALVNLGNVRLKLGHPEEAEALYREALAVDPDHVEANYNLANLLEEQGDLENAVLFYRKALHEAPDFADAHFNLARLLERQGKLEEAKGHWRRYLELDPFSEWAEWARRRLED